MKNYDCILFDLDGTLTDSAEGIMNSFIFALDKFGVSISDRTELFKCVGPPLWESFQNFYNLSESQTEEALKQYQVYYTETGIYENRVYDGVDELLNKLHAAGKRLVLASSKKERHVKAVLEHFGLDKYFDFIAGSSVSVGRLNKVDVIKYILETLRLSDTSGVIMVGDREHDIFGAAECGLDSVGVLYGYGCREEFEAAGATYIVETVEDLGRLFGV